MIISNKSHSLGSLNVCFAIFICCLDYTLSFNGSSKWNNVMSKIVGGKKIDIAKYPHAVRYYNGDGMCGGSILNSWCVLTAAHCTDINMNPDNMGVVVGSRYINELNSQGHDVMSVVVHEEYNASAHFSCDIALLFLKTPIKFGSKVKKGLIIQNKRWMNVNEKNFIAIGWGWTKFEGDVSLVGLQAVRLSYVSKKECERNHGVKLTPDMFCLYGDGIRDTCKGDSGGGVMLRNYIVGITSHGDGCAKKFKPSIYSNVWYFKDWIETQVNNFVKRYCKSRKN